MVMLNIDSAGRNLLHQKVHTNIAHLLGMSWRAERICSVLNQPAIPIAPTRGIPQGCPCSPMVLAYILAPWPHILRRAVPTADAWAYVDDRSIKIRSNHDHEQHLQAALQVTTKFDDDIGLVQNHKKQQLWGPSHSTTVEQLGTTDAPGDANRLLLPRSGWDKAT